MNHQTSVLDASLCQSGHDSVQLCLLLLHTWLEEQYLILCKFTTAWHEQGLPVRALAAHLTVAESLGADAAQRVPMADSHGVCGRELSQSRLPLS